VGPVRALQRFSAWLHAPLPESRAAVFAVAVYAFLLLDVLYLHPISSYRGALDGAWYQPLLVGRILPLPVPTETVVAVSMWGSVSGALAAVALLLLHPPGRWARVAFPVLGWVTAALWFEFQVVAFSYGKVDHDRFGYLLALCVVPALGLVRLRSGRLSENAGWVLRTVQLGVIATYFYAAFAKLRFGGPEWVNSATVARAVIRRGTELAEPLLQMPWTLVATQWSIVAFELAAPLVLLVSERWRRRAVAGWYSFHAVTYAMITIAFWPHLLCLLAFLPLERLVRLRFAQVEPPPRTGPALRPRPYRSPETASGQISPAPAPVPSVPAGR